MSIQRAAPINELLAKIIFLILPTALVSYFVLLSVNDYYSILGNQAVQHTMYFAGGMLGGALFYAFRFRFLPTFILLIIGLYTVYKGLDSMAMGEFDAFFISVRFLVFAILFTLGWFTGWGFIRLRYWSVFVSAALLCACIFLIAKFNADSVEKLLSAFAPVVLYAVYIIFTSVQIYNYKDKSQKFWWYLTRRLVFFGILAILLLGGVVYMMQGEIKETVANYGGGGKAGDNSMLKQNKDGTFDLKNYSRLKSSLGRNNELLFCAYIDNFFPNTKVPNPLYLTAFYYTKFDTATETFERDEKIPFNDLFEPDPSKLPVFFTKSDSSVIRNSLGSKLRTTVNVEIYNKKLSPGTYLAPNVGYFVQPITVEKEFRQEFKSAYRAKSYVSELNSAYFVYNSTDSQVRKFQQQRFDVLRTVKGYEGTDRNFMQYYTYMPGDNKFKTISRLADSVTRNANTPVDKVLAIRDFFLSKDENGDPLFQYTDNPGVPDIPSASKLMYFLFENRKGYCAYYAGATLFMLRSLGIPSRIAVGFLTMDRSDKNKGWYWYYADQAHAWVQVYFPGFGWLDFDTTVGNSDAQESPQPDGTPPMQPSTAWLAADGVVETVDTAKKILTMNVTRYVFHDKEYKLAKPMQINMDMKIAAVRIDSIEVPMSRIVKGDEATAVSYAEALKLMQAQNNETAEHLAARFPSPAPIDEVYLKRKDVQKKENQAAAKQTEEKISPKDILQTAAIVAGAIILLVLLLPTIIYRYFMYRYTSAKDGKQKSYWGYRTMLYYLHQAGIERGMATPMQFARNTVDPRFGTNMAGYMNIYLKVKYTKQAPTANEQEYVSGFVKPFIAQVRKQVEFRKRFIGFINPSRSIAFFNMPKEDNE
jgi:hypothetical protein